MTTPDYTTQDVRADPETGNAYVLRSMDRTVMGIIVTVSDVFGGHIISMSVDEWLEWKVVV